MLTVVTHTDHDGLDLFEGRVTQHRDLILRLVVRVIIDDVRDGVAHPFVTGSLGSVTGCLGIGERRKREIEHILLRPHFLSVNRGVVIIDTLRRETQRDLIFVVVIAQIGTETDEAGEVAVFKQRVDLFHLLRMDEHLQVLILADVVSGILVHGACIVRTEVHDTQHHRLFVLGDELCLTRVGLSAHSRREDVVNRRTGTVLLDINRLHADRRGIYHRDAVGSEITGVLTPFTAHEVHGGKTKIGIIPEFLEVDTHKTNGFPVADTASFDHIFAFERYLELVPGHILGLTVTQCDLTHFLLRDILLTDLHHIGAQDDLIFVVFLVLVERIILVDIFDIRREGRSRTVTLGLLLGSG